MKRDKNSKGIPQPVPREITARYNRGALVTLAPGRRFGFRRKTQRSRCTIENQDTWLRETLSRAPTVLPYESPWTCIGMHASGMPHLVLRTRKRPSRPHRRLIPRQQASVADVRRDLAPTRQVHFGETSKITLPLIPLETGEE